MSSELENLRPLEGDYLSADPAFSSLLRKLAGPEAAKRLEERLLPFARLAAGRWNTLAEKIANDYTGPRIEAYGPTGERRDDIWLPPPARQLRRETVEAGVLTNESRLEEFAKVYFLGHLGESSLTCPLACTAGLIRVMEHKGSAFLKEHYLPRLRSAETPLAGAQFITEQDCGSDIGALKARAVPNDGGNPPSRWKLYGEKWFCSAIDEYFLIAARPEGAPAGTDGVGIFFVPRLLDGRLNDLKIKRLKSKIGTRELPTAEIELEGATAYNIGPVTEGFKNLMNDVINTSRLMNAAAALGMTARAALEAENYTRQRSAFGRTIAEYPLVRESLGHIRDLLSRRRALFFHLISEINQKPQTNPSTHEAVWQRTLINLCKYRTAIGATEAVHEAILLLAGNGTIETFSILPRLYRDSLVIETWEGTHNTLALQVARDGMRFPFAQRLKEETLPRAARIRSRGDGKKADWIENETKHLEEDLKKLDDSHWVESEARRLIDRLGSVLETAVFEDLQNSR